MTVSGVAATSAVALLQGGLVALPRGNALESLRRLRSPAWAGVLPGCIVVGTFAPLGAQTFAVGLVVLAALATPPLAAVAVLAVIRGPRAALVALALIAAALTTLAGGWAGELSATFITALGALTVGAALARLIPSRWVLAGVVCMSVVDVAFLAAGVGQPAAALITQAAGHVPGPLLDRAQIGPVSIDYPDLVLAAVLGGFLAGQRGQRRAAAIVSLFAAISLVLAPPNTLWPATVPAAITLILLFTVGRSESAEVAAAARQPALA